MKNKITKLNPSMLKWARERLNISLESASETMNVRIKELESGKIFLSYPQLKKLADLYSIPLVVFFLPEPPQIKNIKASCRTLPGDVYDELSTKVLKMMDTARLMQLNLYELYNGQNSKIYRFNYFKDYVDSHVDLRKILNFGFEKQILLKNDEEVLKYLRDQLFEMGVFVFKESFQDTDVSGFCINDEKFPVIMINNNNTFTRQIFTLFHELYHLITDTSGIDFINLDSIYTRSTNVTTYQEELKSNQYAADILISRDELNNNFNSDIVIDRIMVSKVALKYKISREMLTRQLYKFNYISYQEMINFVQDFSNDYKRIKKDKPGGNYYSTQLSYLGENYLKKAYNNYYNGQITSKDLTRYLRMNLNSVRTLAQYKGWGNI